FTILRTAVPECRLATVDLTSGLVTATSDPASGEACVPDLTETSDGRVVGIREVAGAAPSVHLIQFDTTTGTPPDLGAIGTSPASLPDAGGQDGGIAFDAHGNLFVAMAGQDASCNDSAYCLYKVDPANPANATFIGTGTQEIIEQALTVACDG